MNILKESIGIALVVLAWFDPLQLGTPFKILFFILGFDLLSLFPKIGIFLIDYFLVLSGLGWMLLFLVIAECIVELLLVGKLINLTVKPLAVFAIIYMNNFGLELALIVAGIDLLLNLRG